MTNIFQPEFDALNMPYVDLLHLRTHVYVPRDKTKKRSPCAICGGARTTSIEHFGFPRSFNAMGSGDQFQYQNDKKLWEARFIWLLERSGLPKNLGFVRVEGTVTFPNRATRDEDNYRFPLSKFLGDALQRGGWLTDDNWSRYRFGSLEYDYDKGIEKLALRIYPSDQQNQLAGGAMAD